MIRNLMKNLLGLAAREDATTGELAPGLPAAEAELAAAREAQEAAKQAYRASLLDGDDALSNRLDVARREAAVRIDRAEALVAALQDRLAEAQAREAEVARIQRHEAARRQADDAAAALLEMYPQLAQGLVDLLEAVARAEAEVRAVNSDLPKGAECIELVERRVRDGTASKAWTVKLAETINLPGFYAGDPVYYKPFVRPIEGNTQPEEILHHIARLRTASRRSPR